MTQLSHETRALRPTHPRAEPTQLLTSGSAAEYAELLHTVVDSIAERFRTVRYPGSGASRSELASLIDSIDLDGDGIGSKPALAEADELYARNAVWFHVPGYAAHLNCPVLLPAVAAEALLASINTSVDTYDQSLIATLMERRLLDWAASSIGFTGGDGIFTSGGTQSNLQALYLAREKAMSRSNAALGDLRVFTTAASHFSIARSCHLLGLSPQALIHVATDAEGRMDPDALRGALADLTRERSTDVVVAVAITAGTTDRGVIDPIAPISSICAENRIWLHVDAAYGGGLLLSPTRRSLLDGIERASSVTIDFHKTFFQPVSSSALIVSDAQDLSAASWHADYLNPADEAAAYDPDPNQVDRSLQTTRRFDALKLWTTLRALGSAHVGALFDEVCDLAERVREDLLNDPEFRVFGTTDLSTVLFRYQPHGLDDESARILVPEIRADLLHSGRAMVARTVVDGSACLKLTLLNPHTTQDDLADVIELVRVTARGLLAKKGERA
ncbi:L-2,4-diaminobutyrate decarboxylase [Agreia bicolorata]|uniref:L-2,4-diaminobutyrate decarboxylase n=1 Tax=Agreia bicolorata TaxID=110935 RepID=A0A1T4YF62_9MICO|nr:aminotransferase class V-fold PLP-dependent enzyme [Agreia bicolorata]SKB00462.1 L-2,4-diaminobutyrate decarboxylase [Agreia bicolorata]